MNDGCAKYLSRNIRKTVACPRSVAYIQWRGGEGDHVSVPHSTLSLPDQYLLRNISVGFYNRTCLVVCFQWLSDVQRRPSIFPLDRLQMGAMLYFKRFYLAEKYELKFRKKNVNFIQTIQKLFLFCLKKKYVSETSESVYKWEFNRWSHVCIDTG